MSYSLACKSFVAASLICTLASAAERLRSLNVAALDPQGQPVTGLLTADFQLSIDGKPQTIAFSRSSGDRPLPGSGTGPTRVSNRPAIHATVILLDLLNDRTLSGSEITNDTVRAVKNLESTEGLYIYILTAAGKLYPVHPLLPPDSEATPSGKAWTENIGPLLQSAFKTVFGLRGIDESDVFVRLDLTASALLDLGWQMRSVSGRKSLVWVTHGLPLYATSVTRDRVDLSLRLGQICQELEQSQIVVYPVQQSTRGAAAAIGTESEETLDEVAGLTGGRKYRSGRVDEAIQASMTDVRANYQLAYYPGETKPDGKRHKLRVTSTRKDVRLLAATGFYATAPQANLPELKRKAFDAVLHSPFDASAIGLRASVSPAPDAAPESLRCDISIDAADLLMREVQNRHVGRVSLWFATFDGAGWNPPGSPGPADLSLTAKEYESSLRAGIELRQVLRVGANARKLRAIVVDEEMGSIGSVTIPIVR